MEPFGLVAMSSAFSRPICSLQWNGMEHYEYYAPWKQCKEDMESYKNVTDSEAALPSPISSRQ
jgi:hypothetical protein